uniref:Uncharacterized protein n=1 Tax=Rhizophora mucronata TaxID=61149 RepID=A0A2P2N8F7_RHIMU
MSVPNCLNSLIVFDQQVHLVHSTKGFYRGEPFVPKPIPILHFEVLLQH